MRDLGQADFAAAEKAHRAAETQQAGESLCRDADLFTEPIGDVLPTAAKLLGEHPDG